MRAVLQTLAALTKIDMELADLQEELGDLPTEVKRLEKEVRQKQQVVDTTQQQLDEVLHNRSNLHVHIQEFHDKEKKLTEQQFQVRNNREFDAISKEIETIKQQLRDAERDIGIANVTEENLVKILNEQKEDLEFSLTKLNDKEEELKVLSSNHDEEMTDLLKQRGTLTPQISESLLIEYERIKEYHTNAAVPIRRNSCSGCFNAVPAQNLVEMRAYKNMYRCEHCSRFVYPEDMEIPTV